jgi:hypothetical protein
MRVLTTDVLEGWICGGDPSHRFRETSGNISLTPKVLSMEESEF